MISRLLKNLVAALLRYNHCILFIQHLTISQISCKSVYIHSWNYQTNKVITLRFFLVKFILYNGLLCDLPPSLFLSTSKDR